MKIFATSLTALSLACLGACSPADDAVAAGWQASDTALGPITTETVFSVASISGHLPGYEVTLDEWSAEGEAYPVIIGRAASGGVDSLVFLPSMEGYSVARVLIRQNGLVENAVNIAAHGSDLGVDLATCLAGMEERSGQVICNDPAQPSLYYWITVDFAGPDGMLPPVDVIAAGTITEISWQPVGG